MHPPFLRLPSAVFRPLASALLLAVPALALLATASTALAQGSLTPPGAPAATMKTLDQIEPRTPLQAGAPGVTANANGGFTITAPGSYYLTGNLTVTSGDGLQINTNDVTLDLSGFTIAKREEYPAAGAGILVSNALSGIVIRNGHIRSAVICTDSVFNGPGWQYGIIANHPRAIRIEDISVFGVANGGIVVSTPIDGINTSSIRRCLADTCGETGLQATFVADSEAGTCGSFGIDAEAATNCYGKSRSCGIRAKNAVNCYGDSTSSTGIVGYGIDAGVVSTCIGTANFGYGIKAGIASNSRGTCADGTGLSASTASYCLGVSSTGFNALDVSETASFCQGVHGKGGVAIRAQTAIGCSAPRGSIEAVNKYLMP